MRLKKQDIVTFCNAITKTYGITISTHCENNQHVIELGEVHFGTIIFRGTAGACITYLAGFEKGILEDRKGRGPSR